jgi:outer membrane protein insertion porin family
MPGSLLIAPLLLSLALPFEGEAVGSVRIEAPGLDAASFAPYVELEAGQPLAATRIRHIVDLLYATGELADVVVEAERGATGLQVVFRLVPAPLLADVRVEGEGVVTPKQILHLARLAPREPLWPARLDAAARDVAVSLANDGYLEARVTAAAVSVPGGSDAIFTVHAGQRVVVSEVKLAGAPLAGAAPPWLAAGVRPGHTFRRARVGAAAEAMRKELVSHGHWRASVEVREAYDPARGRVALTFEVDPGPITTVSFEGDRLPSGLPGRVEAVLREGRMRGDAVEEATDRIETDFRSRGYRNVVVTHREESRPPRSFTVFDVKAGPVALVEAVALIGIPESLRSLLATRPQEPLEDRVLEADVRTLTRALEDDGYAEAKVELEAREGGGEISVVFRGRLGPRILVAQYSVETPGLDADAATRNLRVTPGQVYRARDLVLDRTDLLARYRDAGFLQAEVRPEVELSADHTAAQVALRSVPGTHVFVDHIVIRGLEHTQQEVVRRELLIREGGPLSLQSQLDTQRRLGALGIFDRVHLSEMDPESVERRSLVVDLDEAPRTTFAYGVGWAERERLRGNIEVTRRNLFGMDRSLSAFVRGSQLGNRVLLTYREPYLFGKRQDFFGTVFREEEQEPTFSFLRFGGSVQAVRSLPAHWSLVLRYLHQHTKVFDTKVPLDEVDRQFRTTTFSGPSVAIFEDTRDDPLDPRKGRFFGADLGMSTGLLGSDSFMKGFVQLAGYRRVTSRATLALSARLGLARTFGVEPAARLPLPDRFFAGGDYGLRGFKLDTVGPLEPSSANPNVLLPTGGNALLLGGSEMRFDVGRYVSFAAFGELGNVYSLVSDMSLHDLRYTAGLGIRYKSALGPLRVDWGYKLNRRPGEQPYRIHVTIGHAF